MSSKKAQGSIKLLLEAEQRASEIVKEAKKERLLKLKQAREEADKEIAKYRQQREKQFLKYKEEHLGTGTDESEELERRKQMAINEINERVRQKSNEVIDFMVKYVVEVNTEIDKQKSAQIRQLMEKN
jgi:V-type H+-transporting ATPase subunit G